MKTLALKLIAPVVEVINDIRIKLDTPEKSHDDIILDFEKLGFGDVLSVGRSFESPVDSDEWQTILE